MNKSDIRNIAVLAPAIYLYQNIFLWSNNVSMFLVSQLAYSFCAVLLVSVICYFLFYMLLSLIYSKLRYNKWIQLCIAVFTAVFIGIISNFFSLRTIFSPYHHAVMWILIIGITCIIYFNLVKYFLKFCYILILIASCMFGYNIYKNLTSYLADTDDFLIELKDKPNIYLFWLESFNGAKTLTETFHVDISPLTVFLEENDFTVKENIFSSSGSTLMSMTDVYSMGNVDPHNFQTGLWDVKYAVRDLLGGGYGNNLLKTLKYNGYVTDIITDSNYYFFRKNKSLDKAPYYDTFHYKDNFDMVSFCIYNLYPAYAFCKYGNQINAFGTMKFNQQLTWEYYNSFNLRNLVEAEITSLQKENKPYFLAFKGGVFHVPVDGYTYEKDRAKWIESGVYQTALEKSVAEVKEIISMITEKDKNALIIMLGDHGPHTYSGLGLSDLRGNYKMFEDLIYDSYNVYGAVRLPLQYEKFSFDDKEIYINHMNIFIHIFSLLAQDPDYLKLQKVPVSHYGNRIFVENGIINKDYVKADNK